MPLCCASWVACIGHGLLDDGLVKVMPVANAGLAVGVVGGRREDVLPRPLPVGVRVLAGHRVRQGGAAEAPSQVVLVESAHPRQVVEKLRLSHVGRVPNAVEETLSP